MLRVICAKWGNYDDNTITQLHDNVKEKSSISFDFLCFTEFSDEFDKYQHQKDGYDYWDQGGLPHSNKIQLFKLDEKFDKDDKILFLDLDVDIIDDIAYFFELPNDKPYMTWNYWAEDKPEEWKRLYNISHCPLYNSSVMLWKPGQNRSIYNFLKKNADKAFFTYRGIDTFMFHHFGPYTPRKDHFNYFREGVITTHRIHGYPLYPDYDYEPPIIHILEGLTSEEKKNYVSNRRR